MTCLVLDAGTHSLPSQGSSREGREEGETPRACLDDDDGAGCDAERVLARSDVCDACHMGKHQCVGSGEGGRWGDVPDERVPAAMSAMEAPPPRAGTHWRQP